MKQLPNLDSIFFFSLISELKINKQVLFIILSCISTVSKINFFRRNCCKATSNGDSNYIKSASDITVHGASGRFDFSSTLRNSSMKG